MNNSFDINNSAKIASSDEETSGQDSCSSIKTLGNPKKPNITKTNLPTSQGKNISQGKFFNQKTLNEASLSKVNWLVGFEEASNRQLFDCFWLNTTKISLGVGKRQKDDLRRQKIREKRDKKLLEMLPDENTTIEEYNKQISVQVTSMVSGVLRSSGTPGNPIQSMMARNIRHFESIRAQILEKVIAEQKAQK